MSTTKTRGGTRARAAARAGAKDVADALGELFVCARAHYERVVEPYELPLPCAKALHLNEGSISMKDLGARMHCDGSFVTSVADTLEQRGLARREIDSRDRRIKNLVLTEEGVQLRAQLLDELFDDFPGLAALDAEERATLIALLQKMVAASAGGAGTGKGPDCAA